MKTQSHSPTRSRKLVGLERHYDCESCGAEHRSWSRIRACPDCGEHLAVAVIRRAAIARI
jgi:predicted RNA-binding Zn-ribbon protein involved in translation (DUF1610 family)